MKERRIVQYPEEWKRERILWFVHEWIQEHQTNDRRTAYLRASDVAQWGDSQEGLNGVQAMHLFKQLVEESYITLRSFDTQSQRMPWAMAEPQYLSTKGLIEIGELPGLDKRLERSLDALKSKIEGLDVPEESKESKKKAIDSVEELKHFAHGLAPQVTIELGKALLRGLGVHVP